MFNLNIARREFIKCSAAGIAVAASVGKLSGAESEPSAHPVAKPDGSVETVADVLVVGVKGMK